jgi:two-component system chemotaxis response regulator CheY
MKLIVADDSRMVRGIVSRIVEPLGYEVAAAGNGQEALNLLETASEPIDLVLLDWNMPVLTGIDVIRKMRADLRFKNIPVLMVSTESEDTRIKQAMEAGAQGYLTKPFTPDQLKKAIDRALTKSVG